MSKRIKFTATDPTVEFLEPVPASQQVPGWFKGLEPVIDRDPTAKRCVPFLDALTSGYHILLNCDLYWNEETGEFYNDAANHEPVSKHDVKQITGFDIGEGYHNQPFKFTNPWFIETPKGYSCLFTHPINREDLPFKSFTGVVDTDTHTFPVNFPFFIKKGFTGVIPAGTPIAQVIPFKREDWTSEIDSDSGYDIQSQSTYWFKPPMAYYKRHFWHKKRYQ